MPHTINGVGTHYYGKADLRERPGTCEFCGKPGTLQSYTTRYWFVILFIPIIPLGRKRILNQCGRCRRHHAAKLADWEQARTKAMEEGMRKVVEQPGVLEPLTQLHGTCLIFGEWEKADQLSARIEQEFAQDANAQLHLAQTHAFRGRIGKAERLIQRARELDPTLVKAAEAVPSNAPPKPRGRRRERILLGILGAILVGGLLLADWFKAHNRTLFVVNGYGSPLQVRIEGVPELQVAPLSQRSLELPEGSYSAHVSGPLTADLPLEISSRLIVRLFDSRVFVLNPGGMALLVREETLYAPKGSGNPNELSPYTIHYGKPFEIFSNIDYPFVPFPHEIKLDNSETVHKRRLGLVDMPVSSVYRGLLGSNRAPEALSLAEWAMDVHPTRGDVVLAYTEAATNPAHRDRVLSGLKSRLGRRPVEIALHRMYQNLSLENPQNALEAEYDAYLSADPGNSALIYLRGRLASGIAASIASFERAVLADPANSFAQAALAHCRSSQGKWTEALSPAVRACELEPGNSGFQSILDDVRIALGQFEPLEKELRQRCTRAAWTPSASLATLINLLAFRKDPAGALKLCEDLRQPRPGMDAKMRDTVATELRCRAFYAAGDLTSLALEIDKGEKSKTASHRFALLIEQGHLDEADALAEADKLGAFDTLDRSIAWFLQGNATKAAELRIRAAELLQKGGNRDMQAAALLLEEKSLDLAAVADLDIPASMKAIVLTALAQAHPGSAPELVRQARALNTGFAFPRHLLDRALAALGPQH